MPGRVAQQPWATEQLLSSSPSWYGGPTLLLVQRMPGLKDGREELSGYDTKVESQKPPRWKGHWRSSDLTLCPIPSSYLQPHSKGLSTLSEYLQWQETRYPPRQSLYLYIALFFPLQPEVGLPLASSLWSFLGTIWKSLIALPLGTCSITAGAFCSSPPSSMWFGNLVLLPGVFWCISNTTIKFLRTGVEPTAALAPAPTMACTLCSHRERLWKP